MKKLFILTFAIGALFSFSSCSDDPVKGPRAEAGLTVKEVQRAFIGYVGASWCPPCGSAGGPGFKAIRAEFTNEELVGMYCAPSGQTVAHINDGGDAAPYVAELMAKVMKSGGSIPYYSINGENVGGAYTQASYTLSQYRSNIDDLILQSPAIGIAASKTLTQEKLSCNVAVEAFTEYEGDIYYSVLAVEKKVNGFQKVSGSPDATDYEHNNVMRASLVGDGTIDGQELFKTISSGAITTGTRFDETFTLDFEKIESSRTLDWDYTPDNTIIVASVWLKEANGDYTYVNSLIAE